MTVNVHWIVVVVVFVLGGAQDLNKQIMLITAKNKINRLICKIYKQGKTSIFTQSLFYLVGSFQLHNTQVMRADTQMLVKFELHGSESKYVHIF